MGILVDPWKADEICSWYFEAIWEISMYFLLPCSIWNGKSSSQTPGEKAERQKQYFMLFWIIQGLVFPKVRLGLIILENMDTNKIILQMLLLNMQNVNFSMLLYTMLIKHTGQEEPSFLTHCLILTKFSNLFKFY